MRAQFRGRFDVPSAFAVNGCTAVEISKTTNKATYAASLFFPQSNASKWLSPSTALTREAIVCYSASRVFNQTPTSLEISDVSCLFFVPHAPHSPRTKYRSLGRCFDSPLARTTQPYCSCSREETPGVKYQPLWSAHHFLSLPRERALTLEIPISGASEKHYTIAFLESSGKPTYAGNRVRVCCLLLL